MQLRHQPGGGSPSHKQQQRATLQPPPPTPAAAAAEPGVPPQPWQQRAAWCPGGTGGQPGSGSPPRGGTRLAPTHPASTHQGQTGGCSHLPSRAKLQGVGVQQLPGGGAVGREGAGEPSPAPPHSSSLHLSPLSPAPFSPPQQQRRRRLLPRRDVAVRADALITGRQRQQPPAQEGKGAAARERSHVGGGKACCGASPPRFPPLGTQDWPLVSALSLPCLPHTGGGGPGKLQQELSCHLGRGSFPALLLVKSLPKAADL